MLTCVRCGEPKDDDAFVRDRTRTSGRFPWCKACVTAYRKTVKDTERQRPYRLAANGERECEWCRNSLEGEHANRRFCSHPCKDRVRRLKTFGLEPDEYRAVIASNNGHCPICLREPKRWVLDHNHETGEVTGAVCSVCNQSLIAYTRHNVETAQRLVEYLSDPPLASVVGERRYVGPETLAQLERIKGWRKARGYNIGLAQQPYLRRSGG